MTPTVHLAENPGVDLTDVTFEPRPPDRLDFTAEGVVRPSESLLARFEGSTLQPERVEVSVGTGDTVTVDLTAATLRLASVDVGVETPGVDDLESMADDVRPSAMGGGEGGDEEGASRTTGAIAFTVTGSIRDLPPECLEAVADAPVDVEAVTFDVEESTAADGGSPSGVLLEVGLFGYGVVVRRDGTVEVRSRGATDDVEFL